MFEDEYRREMGDLHASEPLIADTVAKMQAERQRPQAQQPPDVPDKARGRGDRAAAVAVPRPEKARKPLFVRVGLPIAACVALVLVGVLALPHIAGAPGQGDKPQYEFQPVQGNTALMGGLQFGAIDQQPDGATTGLRRAECPESFLPEGILEAAPVTFDGYAVYLGLDQQQGAYYAAYRQDSSGGTWTVLRSDSLDGDGFIKALEDYFT